MFCHSVTFNYGNSSLIFLENKYCHAKVTYITKLAFVIHFQAIDYNDNGLLLSYLPMNFGSQNPDTMLPDQTAPKEQSDLGA